MTKPIEKLFHSKDLNIAYAKGKAEAFEKCKEVIENWFAEEYLDGSLGDDDEDRFETSIGSMKNSLRELKIAIKIEEKKS